jgi:hypothetical protein
MKKQFPLNRVFPAGVLAALLLPPLTVLSSETCYLDTPSGFQRMGGASRIGPYASSSECESINRQYFSGAGSCSCSSSSSDSQESGARWDEELRQQENERRRQEEERRRQELERQKEAAEKEAEKRAADAKDRFEKSKQEAAGLLKGSGSLEIKPGTSFFSTGSDLKPKPGMTTDIVSGKAAQIWGCATYIAGYLFPAARKGDLDEIGYLNGQIGMALRGETTGVQCPDVSTPPSVQGLEIGSGSSQIKFYMAVAKEISAQSQDIVQTKKEIARALGKINATDQDIRALERELQTRENAKAAVSQKHAGESIKEKEKAKELAASSAVKIKTEEEDPLAAALAALKRARDAQKKIDECEAMHKKVLENPALAEKLMDTLGK